ncbi:hypothetical protein HEM46_023570, partial [Escherichia coli]|nr:hypothetical protein [Escherichia coli]
IYSHMVTLWGNYEGISQYKAGTQNLTIGSRLYGESSKIQPGVLSGSATLLMILP